MIWVVGALGLVVGAAVGAVVVWRLRIRRGPATSPDRGIPDPGADVVLGMLRSGGMVIGAHDEVLRANAAIRGMGVARGNRIAVPEVLDLVREVRRTRQSRSHDVDVFRGAGTAVQHLAIRVTPHADEVVVLAEDRSVQLRVDETRRDFVANISHELKTPIGAVQILSETIEQAADDPDAVRHFAGRLRREATRLTDMVGQIIELSRLQSDEPLLNADDVQVDELVAEARRRCAPLAERRSITVLTAGDPGLTVWGDADRLADALTNLVQNAIAYSDPGGRVSIGARLQVADDQMVDLAVADNGIGIAIDDLERIFERFYRVDFARSRETGGTGLGLAIVKHIAAVHGGTVDVWSRVDQGSTFTLRLPVHPAGEQAHSPSSSPTTQGSS